MFKYLFGGKAFVNEKILEQNNIKIISKSDLKIDKNNIIATTGSGKFYNGLFKNEHVTVKVIIIIFYLILSLDHRYYERRTNS